MSTHITVPDSDLQLHKCLAHLNYGRREDRVKSTYSIMALTERGLGAKRVHANSTVSRHVSKGKARVSTSTCDVRTAVRHM